MRWMWETRRADEQQRVLYGVWATTKRWSERRGQRAQRFFFILNEDGQDEQFEKKQEEEQEEEKGEKAQSAISGW